MMRKSETSRKRPEGVPLRLAMLGSMPPNRGISTYCLELADALNGRVQLEVISFRRMYPAWLYPGGEQPVDITFPKKFVARIRIRERLTWYNPLTWCLEGLSPAADVLHVHFWSLPLLPLTLTVMLLFRVRGKPVVLTVHNVSAREHRRLYSVGLALLLRVASSVIVHTKAQAKELVRCHRWSRSKLRRVPHGVLRMYRDSRLDVIASRQELELAIDGPLVLFFGTIRPYKGLDTLLESFSEVVRVVPDATLLIVGKCWGSWKPYQELIHRYALDSRVVARLEYVPTDEVNRYFAAADLAAFPYKEFSAQSGAALAAVGCHLPIVASNVGGLEELVLNSEFLVPSGNPAKLAEALISAMRDERTLAELQRDSMCVAQRLSWDSIAEQLVSLYRSLLQPRRASEGTVSSPTVPIPDTNEVLAASDSRQC